MAATICADAASSAAADREPLDGVPRHLTVGDRDMDVADPDDARVDVDAERCKERPAHGSGRHPRGGFAGAGTLEDVTRIAESVLQDPREVGRDRDARG